MSYELKGILIEKYETIVINDRFKKRELVIETKESANGFEYVETIKFQLTQDKCDLLDAFNVGDYMAVMFNVKGKRWEKDGKVNYFNNLDAWKLTGEQNEQPQSANPFENKSSGSTSPDEETDTLPF